MIQTDTKVDDTLVTYVLTDVGANLPAVTENSQRIFLYANAGSVRVVIILSDDFNKIANENNIGIQPDFDKFKEMNINVVIGNWYVNDRRFEIGSPTFKDPVKAVKFEFNDITELDKVLALGVEATLLPMLDEVEAGMEAKLDAEITRLRTLKRQRPKRT
jgi:hypothetical protein